MQVSTGASNPQLYKLDGETGGCRTIPLATTVRIQAWQEQEMRVARWHTLLLNSIHAR
jgi:hypothetical protein